ncbi:MAG: hypothetical protein M1837_007121 [Sclerophora amabilis]|nr:MAG: hypothetical protein M1837_007121 [Sclerophora amabilis]
MSTHTRHGHNLVFSHVEIEIPPSYTPRPTRLPKVGEKLDDDFPRQHRIAKRHTFDNGTVQYELEPRDSDGTNLLVTLERILNFVSPQYLHEVENDIYRQEFVQEQKIEAERPAIKARRLYAQKLLERLRKRSGSKVSHDPSFSAAQSYPWGRREGKDEDGAQLEANDGNDDQKDAPRVRNANVYGSHFPERSHLQSRHLEGTHSTTDDRSQSRLGRRPLDGTCYDPDVSNRSQEISPEHSPTISDRIFETVDSSHRRDSWIRWPRSSSNSRQRSSKSPAYFASDGILDSHHTGNCNQQSRLRPPAQATSLTAHQDEARIRILSGFSNPAVKLRNEDSCSGWSRRQDSQEVLSRSQPPKPQVVVTGTPERGDADGFLSSSSSDVLGSSGSKKRKHSSTLTSSSKRHRETPSFTPKPGISVTNGLGRAQTAQEDGGDGPRQVEAILDHKTEVKLIRGQLGLAHLYLVKYSGSDRNSYSWKEAADLRDESELLAEYESRIKTRPEDIRRQMSSHSPRGKGETHPSANGVRRGVTGYHNGDTPIN